MPCWFRCLKRLPSADYSRMLPKLFVWFTRMSTFRVPGKTIFQFITVVKARALFICCLASCKECTLISVSINWFYFRRWASLFEPDLTVFDAIIHFAPARDVHARFSRQIHALQRKKQKLNDVSNISNSQASGNSDSVHAQDVFKMHHHAFRTYISTLQSYFSGSCIFSYNPSCSVPELICVKFKPKAFAAPQVRPFFQAPMSIHTCVDEDAHFSTPNVVATLACFKTLGETLVSEVELLR